MRYLSQSLSFLRAANRLAILIILILALPMLSWSQSNDLNLSDNDNLSLSWNELFAQGQALLQKQSAISANLTQQISTGRIGYDALTNLSAELSQSNANLVEYNQQIAERMQERDEDLYYAYNEIDELEKAGLKKDNVILKQKIAIILLSIVIGLILIIFIVKIIIKVKTGGLSGLLKK